MTARLRLVAAQPPSISDVQTVAREACVLFDSGLDPAMRTAAVACRVKSGASSVAVTDPCAHAARARKARR